MTRRATSPSGSAPSRSPGLSAIARHDGVARQRRQRGLPAEFALGAGGDVPLDPRRLLGNGRRRRDRPERPALARPGRGGRDRPRGRETRRGPAAPAGATAASRPTRAARRWSRGARRVDPGAKTQLFSLMGKSRGDAAHERHERECSGRRPDGGAACRPRDRGSRRGVASAVNLLDVEAVVIGGASACASATPTQAHRGRDAAPPLRRRPPAGVLVAPLGDLGGAIGAALLASQSETARA